MSKLDLNDRAARLDYLGKCIGTFEQVLSTTNQNVQVFNSSQLGAIWRNIETCFRKEGIDIDDESIYFRSLLRGMNLTVGDTLHSLKMKFAGAKNA